MPAAPSGRPFWLNDEAAAASPRTSDKHEPLRLDDLADATLGGTRKDPVAELTTVPLLILDDLGMRRLPHTAAEDLLEIIMRRYERASDAAHLEPPRRRTGGGDTGSQGARNQSVHEIGSRPPGPPGPRCDPLSDIKHSVGHLI